MISWWGFISGRLALTGDISHYYWESRFFLDNIAQGIYPLWNPGFNGGVPWNFYLRRIGEVNPFYWAITGFRILGLTPLHAYLAFLVLYYFLGLVAFWLLARLFLKDRLTSTAAYLLLLFSWGGQIFCCFDILLFVPLVWFFYFIFAFAKEKKKHQFLGIFFFASIMATTYIPFFTLIIICSFFFFFFLFFMRESLDFFKAIFRFLGQHKCFTSLSLGFFLLACIPNVDFYFESRAGGFVMPSRHLGSTDPSAIAVAVDNNIDVGGVVTSHTVWDIIAYGYFDKVFSNQHDMRIMDFNIAYLFFIVLLLTLINPVSRRTSVLLLTGVFITLMATIKGRFYPFFLSHVFFFRYMRMLQLFFWLAVLPMAILMVMEQLRVFLNNYQSRKNGKVLAFVVIVHVLFFAALLTQEGIVWSSYLVVVLSLIFFILIILGRCNQLTLAVILWLGLIIQPITLVRLIAQNSKAEQQSVIIDRTPAYQRYFLLPERIAEKPIVEKNNAQGNVKQMPSVKYYDNPWLTNINQHIDQGNVQRFVINQLQLFDNTAPADDSSIEMLFDKLSQMWKSHQNLVFLPLYGSTPDDLRSIAPNVFRSQIVYQGDPAVKVLSFDTNTLRLQTRLDRPRFLLWTNGYHPGWHVYIDGNEGRLLRADYAFKGAWIPSGDHLVIFRFATPLRYTAAYVLLFSFAVVLFILVALSFKEGFLVPKEAAIEN